VNSATRSPSATCICLSLGLALLQITGRAGHRWCVGTGSDQKLARLLRSLVHSTNISRGLQKITLTTLTNVRGLTISIAETVQKKEIEGEVLAVGPGAVARDGSRVSMVLKAGDRVLLPEYGGTTVEMANEELHIFRQDDILGKFE
jgi:co-chaperonin GroES (HSP10)